MKCGTRAYVAMVAGEIFGRRPLDSIYDRDEKINMTKGEISRGAVFPTRELRPCGVSRNSDGANYCMISEDGQEHICLSLHGRVFDGYDHADDSHFYGYVDEREVSLYDFQNSDYFTFDLKSH